MAAGVLLPGGVLSMTSSAAERLVRGGSGDAVSGQKLGPLPLEGLVFPPDLRHLGGGVAPLPAGGGDDLGHGLAEEPVQLGHPGQLGVDLPPQGLLPVPPLLPALGEPGLGPAEDVGAV